MDRISQQPRNLESGDRAQFVLSSLGLSYESLRGKRLLDIGTGDGAVPAECRARGVDAIGIDLERALRFDRGGIFRSKSYVVADARALPFPDETFDNVVTFAGPPLTWAKSMDDVARMISEELRVTKTGGDLRIGSGVGVLPLKVLEEVFGKERCDPTFDGWNMPKDLLFHARAERERTLTFELLQKIDTRFRLVCSLGTYTGNARVCFYYSLTK